MDAIDAGNPLVLNGKTIASVADIPLPHEFLNQDLLAQLFPGFGAGIIAAVFSVLNAIVLFVRIRTENQALAPRR
jgi:hypothetical protein